MEGDAAHACRYLTTTGRVSGRPHTDQLARDLLVGMHQPSPGGDLAGWRRSSPPVAVDLTGQADG
jgi:hypothetical protein